MKKQDKAYWDHYWETHLTEKETNEALYRELQIKRKSMLAEIHKEISLIETELIEVNNCFVDGIQAKNYDDSQNNLQNDLKEMQSLIKKLSKTLAKWFIYWKKQGWFEK